MTTSLYNFTKSILARLDKIKSENLYESYSVVWLKHDCAQIHYVKNGMALTSSITMPVNYFNINTEFMKELLSYTSSHGKYLYPTDINKLEAVYWRRKILDEIIKEL